jgi:hypothetical protein
MSTPTPQEMTLDAIRSVPLFASLDDRAASELRDLLRTQDKMPIPLCSRRATPGTLCI